MWVPVGKGADISHDLCVRCVAGQVLRGAEHLHGIEQNPQVVVVAVACCANAEPEGKRRHAPGDHYRLADKAAFLACGASEPCPVASGMRTGGTTARAAALYTAN